MSRSLNKVMLIGNLTRDPELRYTPSGTAVCTMGLATNRSWSPGDGGERREETEFHRIVAWQKLAELCAQLLFKGRKIYVEGRLQTRNWTSQDGQERSTTEVVIDNMIVLDSRRKDEDGAAEEDEVKQVDAAPAASQPAATDVVPEPEEEIKEEPKQEPKKEEKKAEDKKPEASQPAKTEEEKEEVKADDIPF